MSTHSPARAVADLIDGVVLARIDIRATPERVWQALTTSEVAQWWGAPGMYQTTAHTMDLREGGAWRSVGAGANGEFSVEGTVVSVDAPKSLSFTWKPSWEAGPPSLVRYALTPIDGGTRLTVRHSGFTNPAACDDHANGWERVITWLDKHASAPRAELQTYLVRLIPPRPTFLQDMSPTERAVMAEHGQYWRQKLAEGVAIAFGPVADPLGSWGLGVIQVHNADEVARYEAADPVIAAGGGFRYEVIPMPVGVVH